jgi:hypothetical protein
MDWTPPNDDATLAEKLKFQRRVREAWQSQTDLFVNDIPMWLDLDDRWYCHPEGLPPEYVQRLINRQKKRWIKQEQQASE